VKTKNFLAELKRRKVYRVAVAYSIVGWLLIQIATQVFPFFEIPMWVVRLVIVLLVLGFPVALLLAWAFDLTPEGIKRTEDLDESSRQEVAARILQGSRAEKYNDTGLEGPAAVFDGYSLPRAYFEGLVARGRGEKEAAERAFAVAQQMVETDMAQWLDDPKGDRTARYFACAPREQRRRNSRGPARGRTPARVQRRVRWNADRDEAGRDLRACW